ncbi:vWA domain-containing protein [Deinococcus hopiensis]|uniref:von Willebrand factor type A domain-containing protein n=1 Tax=Deinococcus hopiensis KR-140 TaxID=695939 RepID=A0A1W1VB50_9DEIO|nr:VWA domain-containing protein [Deinococcus hopiensis]SMB90545.1 von Willebrand factor type A domain-containing protein [Deinococcus hopiensis KR-140]
MRRAALLLPALLTLGSSVHAGAPVQVGRTVPTVVLERLPPRPAYPAVAAGCALPPGPLPTRTRAVFVLDTSGSMRGVGGHPNIFGRVREAVDRYVHSAKPDRVDLVTFDTGPRAARHYVFPEDAARWRAELGGLRADGQNTYLYRSVEGALAPLDGAGEYITTVFVLTDGIDNDPEARYTARRALAAFRARGGLDTLHYVALGAAIPRAAQTALRGSGYAAGMTLPAGEAPDLAALATTWPVTEVTAGRSVRVPLPDGTPVTLTVRGRGVRLVGAKVEGGAVRLAGGADLPAGTPALLCAPPGAPGGLPRRVPLALKLGRPPALVWLNPGADRTLAPGESVTLRYRLPAATPPVTLALPPGVQGQVLRLPGGRELAVRFANSGLGQGQRVQPSLTFPHASPLLLPAVEGPGAATGAGTDAPGALLGKIALVPALIAGGLLSLALGAWALLSRRRTRREAETQPPATLPTVEGLTYSEDRTLAVVGAGGLETAVDFPLGGPFDLGQQARVPHLSGLRLQQGRDGLRVLKMPEDLEVSLGTRLLTEGDVIRPGSLLGVAVARPARAPHPPLGSLVGLGLPLRLRADGVTLHMTGPYGEHALTLRPGITDLGGAFGASALHGLQVTPSGPHVLLASLPDGLTLRRTTDAAELRPGTYLPPEAWLELGEG